MQYILIADDNNDITDILSVYVKKEGYEPIIAKDGVMAEDMFFKYEPAAVLLDVMMPFKDGYEVCKSIRQKSAVPIILITAPAKWSCFVLHPSQTQSYPQKGNGLI